MWSGRCIQFFQIVLFMMMFGLRRAAAWQPVSSGSCRHTSLGVASRACMPWSLPPSHLTRRDRTQVFASLSGQRYPGNSSKGLDHLLPPGLGKEGHLEASAQLQSPFRHQKWPEPDVAFVIHSLWVWRAFLPTKAAKLRHILRTVARALLPLEEALGIHRVDSAKRVAQGKRPALMACLTVLLRWPDVSQPRQLILGYPIIGELNYSGIFRTVPGKPMPCLSQWFADGQAAVDRIMASRPPLHYEDIYMTAREEQDKGFCSEFMSRSQMDSLFGPGQWRPLERFIIKQPDGKQRVIDNARKTLHNACASLQETISTTTVDFVANVASDILDAFDLQSGPLGAPCWSGWTSELAQMTYLMLTEGCRWHPVTNQLR